MPTYRRVFAIGADYGYVQPVTTLVKSILYHHDHCLIYIINDDFPQEWFANINRYLGPLRSRVVNCWTDGSQLQQQTVAQRQINKWACSSFLIPRVVPAKRVLYLDGDTIVDDNLDKLFDLDMKGKALAAVPDLLYVQVAWFNSGVLLIDTPRFNEDPTLIDRLLKFGQNPDLHEADQEVLNHFFGEKDYYHLPLSYNWAIGYDYLCSTEPYFDHDYFKKTNAVKGKIIHYTGQYKPWAMISPGRAREKWWQYHDLDWNDVVRRAPLVPPTSSPSALIFTNTAAIVHLKDLVAALPGFTFRIAAQSTMAPDIKILQRYPNVILHMGVIPIMLKQMLNEATFVLDAGITKCAGFAERALAQGKPVVTFNSVRQDIDDPNYHVFDDNDLAGATRFIEKLN